MVGDRRERAMVGEADDDLLRGQLAAANREIERLRELLGLSDAR